MKAAKVLVLICVLLVAASLPMAGQFPKPLESDWQRNRLEREDPRPLEIGNLLNAPTVDGIISPGEWTGAATFEVRSGWDLLGTLYFGVYNGQVYTANDWKYNNDSRPGIGGANAWRIGTSNAPGPDNVTSFFDVFIELHVAPPPFPDTTVVWYRPGRTTEEWNPTDPDWQIAPPTLLGAVGWNGNNWQYELGLGDPFPQLPVCWYWEWRQIDPRPVDGQWVPVYNGSIHHTPEPALIQLPSLIVLGGIGLWRFRRRAK